MKNDTATTDITAEEKNDQLVPVSPLGAMLVMPIPRYDQLKRSFWMAFLNDLSYLLPAFGMTLGLMLVFGQAPYLGGGIISVSALTLAFRLLKTYRDYLERKRIAEFEKQYHAYLHQMHQVMNRKRLTG